MKKLILLLIAIGFIATSCEQDSIAPVTNINDYENLTSVHIFPSSPELIADGIHKVDFLHNAFINFEFTEANGNVVLDSNAVSQDFYRDNLNIYTEGGELIDLSKGYSTTSTQDSIGFYAEVGNLLSEIKKVKLVQPVDYNFERITIPIIFHIVSNQNNKTYCDGISEEAIQENVIDRLNKAFSAQIVHATNIDSNIRFELATEDPNGFQLEERGISRHDFIGDPNLTYPWGQPIFIETQTQTYIRDQNILWDNSRYLNVWVTEYYNPRDFFASTANTALPSYTLGDPTALPLGYKTERGRFGPQITYISLTPITDSSQAFWTDLTDVGILIRPQDLISDTISESRQSSSSLDDQIGLFFGLLPTTLFDLNPGYTEYISLRDLDYCSDTFSGKFRGNTLSNIKSDIFIEQDLRTQLGPAYDHDKMASPYLSTNFVEKVSSNDNITIQQILRMRYVLENCPYRMIRK